MKGNNNHSAAHHPSSPNALPDSPFHRSDSLSPKGFTSVLRDPPPPRPHVNEGPLPHETVFPPEAKRSGSSDNADVERTDAERDDEERRRHNTSPLPPSVGGKWTTKAKAELQAALHGSPQTRLRAITELPCVDLNTLPPKQSHTRVMQYPDRDSSAGHLRKRVQPATELLLRGGAQRAHVPISLGHPKKPKRRTLAQQLYSLLWRPSVFLLCVALGGMYFWWSSTSSLGMRSGRAVEVEPLQALEGDTFRAMVPLPTSSSHQKEFVIRLRGVVAPAQGQPYSRAATQCLWNALKDRNVTAKFHFQDPEHRLVADVWTAPQLQHSQRVLLQRQLLTSGCVWYDPHAEVSSRAQLKHWMEEAMANRTGMWAEEAGESPLPPWMYRSGKRNAAGQRPRFHLLSSHHSTHHSHSFRRHRRVR